MPNEKRGAELSEIDDVELPLIFITHVQALDDLQTAPKYIKYIKPEILEEIFSAVNIIKIFTYTSFLHISL
jgi:ribosome-binding factor A